MKITWFGQSSFLVESDDIAIVVDPYDPKIGFTLPKDLKADVVTVSHQHMDHNNVSVINGNPSIISTSGSVTIKGVPFTGIDSFHDNEGGKKRGQNIIFRFTIGGITVAHLGDLGHILNEDQVKGLLGTDILMIPVGGNYTIDGATAVTVVKQIKPKIIIPMHYGIKGRLGFPLDPVESFTEKMSLPVEKMPVLELSKNQLPTKPKVVILDVTQ